MPYLEALTFEYPLWQTGPAGKHLQNMATGRLENPYAHYLALLQHLLLLARSQDLELLKSFADCGQLSLRQPGSAWSRYSLLLFQWTDGPAKAGWYAFDPAEYTALLQDPLLMGCFDGQSFCNLDYFLTAQAELQVFKQPALDSEGLRQVWLEEGVIDFYWETWPLRKALAEVSHLMGWRWFLPATPEQKHYRYALMGLLSQRELVQAGDAGPGNPDRLHGLQADLIALHDLFVLQSAELSQDPKAQELRKMMQAAIDNQQTL